ncbi:Y1281-like protein, partial [Mya arenaria]
SNVLIVIPGCRYRISDHSWRVCPLLEQRILDLVLEMDKARKVLVSECHGPWVLIFANVIRDRKVTCFKAIVDDVVNAGANYSDAPVVVDMNMVTSREPKDLPDFCKALISLLKLNMLDILLELIFAKIIRDRNVTCFKAIDDVVNAGTNYSDAPVVVDMNIVTSRERKDLQTSAKRLSDYVAIYFWERLKS